MAFMDDKERKEELESLLAAERERAGRMEKANRFIFNRTLKLAAGYGDNLFHCVGEQANQKFNKIMAEWDARAALTGTQENTDAN